MKWILTDTEAVEAFYEAQTGGAGRLNVAKAQARKIVEEIEEHGFETNTPTFRNGFKKHFVIDFDYWQQLKKEVGL